LISAAKSSFPGYFHDNLAELISGWGEAHASSAVGTQMISECGADGTHRGRFPGLAAALRLEEPPSDRS
jgi:hypothetical protein